MKRVVMLLQACLMAGLVCIGAEKKYNDAMIFGLYYGNPAEITSVVKKGTGEEKFTYRFDEEGALVYKDGSVRHPIRDEKGRLVSFESGLGGTYLVEYNEHGLPYKFRYKTAMTKMLTDEFLDHVYTVSSKNGYSYRSGMRSSTAIAENGKRTNVTLSSTMLQNPVFDEYGNVKFAVRHYAENAAGMVADEMVYTTIKYWPDRMTDVGNGAERRREFESILRAPGGFRYDADNKRNLYQQLYMDFLKQSGAQFIQREHRSVYKGAMGMYTGIPYEVFFYSSVGGATDVADWYLVFHGTRHELEMLRNELTGYFEDMGLSFATSDGWLRSSGEATVCMGKKKKLVLTQVYIGKPAPESSRHEPTFDKTSMTVSVCYKERKM